MYYAENSDITAGKEEFVTFLEVVVKLSRIRLR
jgi:hypothetical protein